MSIPQPNTRAAILINDVAIHILHLNRFVIFMFTVRVYRLSSYLSFILMPAMIILLIARFGSEPYARSGYTGTRLGGRRPSGVYQQPA